MPWRNTLDRIRERKLDIARLDPRSGMPLAPPKGAPAADVAALERRVGRKLPPSYAEFLALHDGYPDLLHGVSLLGVRHLARGTYDGLAQMVIDLGETPVSPNAQRSWPPTIVPFGVDTAGETFFAWDTSVPLERGEIEVIVWMNDIGARFDGFPSMLDFLLDVLDAEHEGLTAAKSERLPSRSDPARTVKAGAPASRRTRAA